MDFPDATLRQRIGRRLIPLFLFRARISRGMTLGVRCAVLDGEERVFLVKHTYVPGWYLPGGAVDPGETADEAMARELVEEGNIRVVGGGEMRGLYQNREASVRDHVAFYVVRQFEVIGPRPPDREIADCGFFPLDAMPLDATSATRRRMDELAGRRVADGYW